MTTACVGSGFCCKTAPCYLGMRYATKKYTINDHECEYLTKVGDIYRCGLYLKADDEMKVKISNALAFGGGCSSTLFNPERERLIRKMSRSGSSSPSPVSSSDTKYAAMCCI